MLSLLLALAWAADPLPAARDVVERYRDALVLADAVPTLPEGQRRDAPILGKMLFADRRDAERALTETLRADVPVDKGDRGRDVGAFLDWLEGDTLRDGDKLAFGAVLDGLQRPGRRTGRQAPRPAPGPGGGRPGGPGHGRSTLPRRDARPVRPAPHPGHDAHPRGLGRLPDRPEGRPRRGRHLRPARRRALPRRARHPRPEGQPAGDLRHLPAPQDLRAHLRRRPAPRAHGSGARPAGGPGRGGGVLPGRAERRGPPRAERAGRRRRAPAGLPQLEPREPAQGVRRRPRRAARPGRVQPEDRVFVFYAGHGATRALPSGSERGYIVPVDGDTEKLQSTAISMSQLGDVHEALAAKHVMFVMDACYSGIALTRAGGYTGDPRRYLQEITRRSARQILTAGGADEQFTDSGPGGHSIFTWTLLQGMSGSADLNGDGFITASELSSFVSPRVSSVSAQTPAFGNLVGSGGGEFVFTLEPDQALLSDLSGGRADADDLARAKEQLAAENEELQKELARMQAQLEALASGRGAPSSDPTAEASALHNEGIAAFRQGDLARVYSSLRKAAELNGADAEIVNNLGYVLQELDRHGEARPWFERAIELDAERAVAYLNLGDTLAALDERDGAVAAYTRYLEMVPESPVRKRVEAYLGR